MKNISTTVSKIIGHDVILSYPKLIGRIITHKYYWKMQLGMVISSKWSTFPLTRTSKPYLINYTTTVRKMFRVVETLHENSVSIY